MTPHDHATGENVPENQKAMTRKEFLLEMDDILGLRSGTLRGDEKLDELPNWDSTALIGLIVLAESMNDVHISPEQVIGCTSVADLLKLAKVEDNAS